MSSAAANAAIGAAAPPKDEKLDEENKIKFDAEDHMVLKEGTE